MRFFAGITIVISLLLSVVALSSCSPQDRYIEFSGFAQGGVYTVKMNLNGRDGMIKSRPQTIKDSVDAILGRVDASLSGYNRKSLLSRFNEGQQVVPDEMFLDIYEKAYDVCKDTDGVVDAASAALFDIWGFGFKNGEMPDDERVAEVLSSCGFKRLSRGIRAVYETEGTVGAGDMLEDASGTLVKLNYNALAQGYSCDKVAEYLYSIGVKDMMVDIGEIFCDGVNPSGKEWGIGIDRPVDGNNSPGSDLQAVFRVPKGPHGVVTSGNYRKFYVKDGKKYAHTIDPRTGYPVTHNLLSATILAADGFTADAYATYCMVVGLEESVRFIESTPEIEGCLVYDDNGEFKTWTSSGMTLSGL